MIKLSVLSACVASLFFTTTSWAQREISGHPLVALYEGAELGSGEQFEFDTYRLVTGFDFEDRIATGITIEGRITRLYHDNPDERSEHEIFANYLEAFGDAGLSVIFQCAGDGECFTGSTRNANRNFNSPCLQSALNIALLRWPILASSVLRVNGNADREISKVGVAGRRQSIPI